jgi:hypothetical protein
MKFSVLILAVAAAAVAGCSTRYSIIMTNGSMITAKGKPQLDKSGAGYWFMDASGKKQYISMGSVREVGPVGTVKKSDYLPDTTIH